MLSVFIKIYLLILSQLGSPATAYLKCLSGTQAYVSLLPFEAHKVHVAHVNYVRFADADKQSLGHSGKKMRDGFGQYQLPSVGKYHRSVVAVSFEVKHFIYLNRGAKRE